MGYNNRSRYPVILIVEDEDVVLEFAQTILESAGYEVLTARNSVEALHLGAAYPGRIDILLTDVEMRIFQNGMELGDCFQLLRPETCVVLTSGSCLPDDFGGHAALPKAWTFLPKPFTHWQLLETVRTLACSGSMRTDAAYVEV